METRDLEGNAKLASIKDHTVIDIGNTEDVEPYQDPSYVEAYIRFMYLTCISPFDPYSNTRDFGADSWLEKTQRFIQKVSIFLTNA